MRYSKMDAIASQMYDNADNPFVKDRELAQVSESLYIYRHQHGLYDTYDEYMSRPTLLSIAHENHKIAWYLPDPLDMPYGDMYAISKHPDLQFEYQLCVHDDSAGAVCDIARMFASGCTGLTCMKIERTRSGWGLCLGAMELAVLMEFA